MDKQAAEPAYGWAIRVSRNGQTPWIAGRFYWSRKTAIELYNEDYAHPNAYRRDRRRGLVKAVRIAMQEVNNG